MLLQQTLESARDALASAQKVMADVDEITGDPALRNQLRNLINGLGNLVSSTQSLEQQTEVARMLVPVSPAAAARPSSPNPQLAPLAGRPEPAIAADRSAPENLEQPVLVFDGERYIIRLTDRLAEKGTRETTAQPSRLVLED